MSGSRAYVISFKLYYLGADPFVFVESKLFGLVEDEDFFFKQPSGSWSYDKMLKDFQRDMAQLSQHLLVKKENEDGKIEKEKRKKKRIEKEKEKIDEEEEEEAEKGKAKKK